MQEFIFKALGTKWRITIDSEKVSEVARNKILEYIVQFESRFSRFLPGSEVNAFRNSRGGAHIVSDEFAQMLERARLLRKLTDGIYNPAIGGLLESVGYGSKNLELINDKDYLLQDWDLLGNKLSVSGPIAFDLGGIGKGYCIDKVADILRTLCYENFLVDGGGDMFCTTKCDSTGWRVAIEYPGRPDTAAGVVVLKNQGLAVSDTFRRRWGSWHHLVHAKEKKPITETIGCAAIAPSAWSADCMTSGLFFSSHNVYPELAKEFQASYLSFQSDGRTFVSHDWEGELY